MEHGNLNPGRNSLPSGVSEDQILDAVRRSGYPLQIRVQNVLRKNFPNIEPEWSYIDSDTSTLRALDILAQNSLYDLSNQERIRPWLSLLVECKQSELPYVFFKGPPPEIASWFPRIAGLASRDIKLIADDSISTMTMSITAALGVDEPRFASSALSYTSNLTKAMRNRKDLELTSQETFNEIVLPLVKSMRYFEESRKPRSTHYYFDALFLFGVCVLNAPMVAVEAQDDEFKLSLVPWMRVIRQEANPELLESSHWTESSELYAIDLVHEDFLESYVTNYVLPFADSLQSKFVTHSEEIAEGFGHVQHLFVEAGEKLLAELRPVSKTHGIGRTARLFRNILSFPFGKGNSD